MNYLKQVCFLFMATLVIGCSDDDDGMSTPPTTGDETTYELFERSDSGVSGTAKIEELDDGTSKLTLNLNGTPDDGMHPSHIHANTAVEGGDIIISLNEVDGSTGVSETIISEDDEGDIVTYQDLLEIDGYINVHLSSDDLATVVAQGDIGQNELTGENKSYTLGEKAIDGINGSVLFEERENGEALATINLENTPEGGQHPAHIHANTAVESGGIIYTFTPVDGTSGMSQSNVAALDDDTEFGYADVLEVDGYVNVHLSAEDLATIVAQGDIGQNELTGEEKSYTLNEKDVDGINGTVSFEERKNGEALATINLENTPEGGEHPAHIHQNTAVEGGGILYTFTPVDGTSGMSQSNVATLDDDTEFGYADVLEVDGYVNVHLSADNLATIVAQGDIGQNELTGEEKSYSLDEKDAPGISGSVLFEERKNGEALATISLNGTPDDGEHPAHIHTNSAVEGGGIIYTFNPVNGATGMSQSNIAALDDDSEFGYGDVLEVDGYVNVHLSAEDLSTIVAQGDIGQNELTGETQSYTLNEKDAPGISGSVLFEERKNGEALATISLDGTPNGGSHPAHIHANTAIEGGGILYTFTPVDGTTGMSQSNVAALDDDTEFGYTDVLEIDGYVNVHLSADNLATIVAQGDIGQNELTGESQSYVLDEKDITGASGSILFEERKNGEALATISLEGTLDDVEHPAHIHENSASEGGGIIYTFTPVDGTSGMSQSNVAALDDDTEFGYADVLDVDGYVNVHLSANNLETLVAQGNIGVNAN